MKIEVPQYKTFDLKYLIVDYNGTVATDGKISPQVKERLRKLAEVLKIYVLTADTYGNAKDMCRDLPVTIYTFPSDGAMGEKQKLVNSLGGEFCVAMGNGRNDTAMCRDAALSIAVAEREGCWGRLISEADVCVTSIIDGLDLLLYPNRLIATLRG